MKILFLAPRLPFPTDTGGKIRTYNILKQIALENQVHLICFAFEHSEQRYMPEFERWGIKVTLVPIKEPTFTEKILAVLFNRLPFSIAKYKTPQMKEAIQTILKTNSFEAIHVDHLHMAHYQDYFRGIPCMLDEHNVEYKILERCADVEKSFLKKILYKNQAKKMKTFESQKCKQFQGIFACSLDDVNLLKSLTNAATLFYVIPNGVDTEYFELSGEKNLVSENTLVFTGSMDWLPNDDAITYFCKEILPLIWGINSSVKLCVVGKSPSAAVKNLAVNDKRVSVTGRVEDVRPYMARSTVFIVPLRIGGGTRLKILEAMSMRKAIVSTTIGAEGISYSKDDIVLADTPEDFAQVVCQLINDPSRIISMGEKGRVLVCQKYDWKIVGHTLNTIYNEVIYAKR
jgi:polysaccharide biosynthesis protein PslH